MAFLPQILFLVLTLVSVWLFSKKAIEIKRNIFLGKPEDLNNHAQERWRNLFLLALGQKKMFQNPLVAVMHLV
ncbi:MAG: Fe-S oxidoreductase, partial [Sediminibacterium sp.]